MVIHVKDERTDWLVRDFARRRGLGITEAIRVAVEEASARERHGADAAWERLQPILSEIRSRQVGGFGEAQLFIDDMWENK
jgi:antitoxin VapB